MEEEKKELEVQELETPEKEEVSEETPVNEKQEEKQTDELPGLVHVTKYEDERPYVEVVESARKDFLKVYNSQRRLSYIMMAIVMVLAVGSVFLITQTMMALKIIGWSLIGVAIIGMLVFYIVTRNKVPALTKDYIQKVNHILNSENFIHPDVSEPMTDEKEKIESADIIVENVYADLGQTASRNVIHAKYKGHSFLTADLGAYNNATGRKRSSLFVGKHLNTQNTLHFEGRIIINLKAKENPVDLPTALEDLAILSEEDNFIIYGPKDADIKKIFGTKFLPALKKIKLDDNLLNANFVFWAGRSSAYLSYTDDIMTLPFQHEFVGNANSKYKADMYDVLEAFSLINK